MLRLLTLFELMGNRLEKLIQVGGLQRVLFARDFCVRDEVVDFGSSVLCILKIASVRCQRKI